VRASRLKRFLPLLVVAYVLLELWLMVIVAEQIGWLLVLLLLLAGFVAGASVIKRAGLKAFAAVRKGGALPEGDARTAVAMAGGVLLMIPGFITDVLGLLCLVPPVARRLQRAPMALLRRGPLGDAVRLQEQVRMHRPDGKVVQGEVVQEDGSPTSPYDYSRRDDEGPYGSLR
jgi:UPF0716 protein FxsA